MIRPFLGVQALGAASQPVFGTTLTAASTMMMDQHTLNTSPGSQDSVSTVTVASTAGFRKGDRVALGPKADFVFQGVLDTGLVIAVVSSTVLTVQSLLTVHAIGDYLLLNEAASSVNIVSLSTANLMYLGNASTVAANDASVFDVLPPLTGATSEPTYWHYSPPTSTGDSYNTIDYWIEGTDGDIFFARISVV